jgi:CheY-like chemotaxis protein
VYGIVSQSGGWIDVQSSPARGARFTVYLPRSTELPAAEEEAGQDLDAPGRGTVLVAEDEDAVRKVVAATLRQRGYDVLEAGSGGEALRVAAAHDGTLELLVTDEMMPGMRGTQLATELLARRTGVRVLFMSGYTDRVPSGNTYAGAPSAFLAKPFSHEQLLQVVATLLHR